IRFQDLARGGLRTVFVEKDKESAFFECYNLAHTQHKKNKDIPEGGAKAVIHLYGDKKDTELLYRTQKVYIDSLLTLVNCDNEGKLRAPLVDLYGKPEYLYLGPDENM